MVYLNKTPLFMGLKKLCVNKFKGYIGVTYEEKEEEVEDRWCLLDSENLFDDLEGFSDYLYEKEVTGIVYKCSINPSDDLKLTAELMIVGVKSNDRTGLYLGYALDSKVCIETDGMDTMWIYLDKSKYRYHIQDEQMWKRPEKQMFEGVIANMENEND